MSARPIKLAVTGKGGVGKTTVSALLASMLQKSGRKVIAIDADPDANLLAALGHPKPDSIAPLVELKDLIEERTGAKPGTTGGFFKINPRVEDIPDRYAVTVNGIKVLVAGAVKHGGSGCYCPENAFVRALVTHLLLDKDAALILDMEPGVEHLSRATVESVDQLLVVVEPGRLSVETAHRIQHCAEDIGLTHICAVGNKVQSEADRQFLQKELHHIKLIGCVPYDERLRAADQAGKPLPGASIAADLAVAAIVAALEKGEHTPAHTHPHSKSERHAH